MYTKQNESNTTSCLHESIELYFKLRHGEILGLLSSIEDINISI